MGRWSKLGNHTNPLRQWQNARPLVASAAGEIHGDATQTRCGVNAQKCFSRLDSQCKRGQRAGKISEFHLKTQLDSHSHIKISLLRLFPECTLVYDVSKKKKKKEIMRKPDCSWGDFFKRNSSSTTALSSDLLLAHVPRSLRVILKTSTHMPANTGNIQTTNNIPFFILRLSLCWLLNPATINMRWTPAPFAQSLLQYNPNGSFSSQHT